MSSGLSPRPNFPGRGRGKARDDARLALGAWYAFWLQGHWDSEEPESARLELVWPRQHVELAGLAPRDAHAVLRQRAQVVQKRPEAVVAFCEVLLLRPGRALGWCDHGTAQSFLQLLLLVVEENGGEHLAHVPVDRVPRLGDLTRVSLIEKLPESTGQVQSSLRLAASKKPFSNQGACNELFVLLRVAFFDARSVFHHGVGQCETALGKGSRND